jgi:hypothetical protein
VALVGDGVAFVGDGVAFVGDGVALVGDFVVVDVALDKVCDDDKELPTPSVQLDGEPNKFDALAAEHDVEEQYSQQYVSHERFGHPPHVLFFAVLSDEHSDADGPTL